MLAVWERARAAPAPERAIAVLAAADPGTPRGALLELPVGERDRRLLAVRAASFSSPLLATCECPACEIQLELDLTELPVPPAGPPDPGVRPVDTRALLAAAEAGSPERAREILADHCGGGQELAPEALEARLEAIDPAADLRVALRCPGCAAEWDQPVEPDRLLWEEIAHAAKRLLGEVDELARAYGWSEAQILGLSPQRRRSYLELAA